MNEKIRESLTHALKHAERNGSVLQSHISVPIEDVRALLRSGTSKTAPVDMTFDQWWFSQDHRKKYSRDHPVYLAALDVWDELSASIADTDPKAHAIDCEYIRDDNPWARCTCGAGGPNDGRKSSADTAKPVERMENTSEHIARDIREGRFPQRSEPQMVAIADTAGAKPVLKERHEEIMALAADKLQRAEYHNVATALRGVMRELATPPAPSVADAPCAVCKDNECFVDGGGDDCKMKKDADALQAKRFRMAVRGGWIREIDVQVIDYEIAKESGND